MKYLNLLLLIAVTITVISCDNRDANLPEISFIYNDSQLYNYQNHNTIEVTISLDAVNSFISEKRVNLEYNSEFVTVVTGTGFDYFVRTDTLGYATLEVIIQDNADNYGHVQIEFQMDDYLSVKRTLTLNVRDMPKISATDYQPSMAYGDTQIIEITFVSETGDASNKSVTFIPDVGTVNSSPQTTNDEGIVEFVYTAPAGIDSNAEIDVYLDQFTDGFGEPDISQRITINLY